MEIKVKNKKEKELQDHYNSHPGYGTALSPEDIPEVLGQLKADIPHKGRVLDLGCGDGRFSFYLSDRMKYKVTGVDYSVVRMDRAGQWYPGPEYLLMDLNQYIFEVAHPDQKFDATFLLDVLEHLENPKEVLDRCRKISYNVIISSPMNMPYTAHLQVFESVPDFYKKCGTAARHVIYKGQIVAIYES
jgi:2-polyprenyl-3-methyl-5-hydroxy-6-metoxy-1,4-benzoquinol methylase